MTYILKKYLGQLLSLLEKLIKNTTYESDETGSETSKYKKHKKIQGGIFFVAIIILGLIIAYLDYLIRLYLILHFH